MLEFLAGVPGKLKKIYDDLVTVDGIVDTILVDTADMQPKVNTINSRVTANVATATALQTVDNEIATIDANVDTLIGRVHNVQTGWTVSARTGSIAGEDDSYKNITISAVTSIAKCYCVFTGVYTNAGGETINYSSDALQDYIVTARLTTTTNLRLATPINASTGFKFIGRWYVVEYE